MNDIAIKVLVDLLRNASSTKNENPVRYYLAARMLDTNGQGNVVVDEAIAVLKPLFAVTRRTARRNFKLAAELGLGTWQPNGRFYYIKQVKAAKALVPGERVSNKTVELSLKDLAGDFVTARALCEAVAYTGGEEQVTMSRETRQNLGGRGAATQRRYDDKLGTDVQGNVLILGEYSDWLLQASLVGGEPAFKLIDYKGALGDPGKAYVARITVNTYQVPVRKARRARAGKLFSTGTTANVFQPYEQTFFGSFEEYLKHPNPAPHPQIGVPGVPGVFREPPPSPR